MKFLELRKDILPLLVGKTIMFRSPFYFSKVEDIEEGTVITDDMFIDEDEEIVYFKPFIPLKVNTNTYTGYELNNTACLFIEIEPGTKITVL